MAKKRIQPAPPAPAPREGESVNALANLLGCDRRTISRAISKAGLRPAGQRSGSPIYRIDDVTEALKALSANRDAIGDVRRRLLEKQVERLEVQISVMRREYVASSDVERWGAELGSAIRKEVCQIHMVAPSVVGVSVPDAEARLKELEVDILRHLHQLQDRIATKPA